MKKGFCAVLLCCIIDLLIIFDGASGKIDVKDGDVIQPQMTILKRKYKKNADQTWNLFATSGHWALVFHYMSIEKSVNCQHDYLQIQEYDPIQRDAVYRPVRYCGEVTPLPYISNTSRITIRFVSDNIWELKGFNITAIHGEQKASLKTKIHEMSSKYTVTLALEAEETEKGDTTERGATFYILIGCSAAALVLFLILLSYFVIVTRKHDFTNGPKVPKLYYISGAPQPHNRVPASQTREPFVRLNSATLEAKNANELCKTGKRRYSKEKKAAKPSPEDTTSVKFVDPSCRSQHNNMYVSNASVHVCPNR